MGIILTNPTTIRQPVMMKQDDQLEIVFDLQITIKADGTVEAKIIKENQSQEDN